jgi:hypothetical protein
MTMNAKGTNAPKSARYARNRRVMLAYTSGFASCRASCGCMPYTSHNSTASASDFSGSRVGMNSCAKYPWNPSATMASATGL